MQFSHPFRTLGLAAVLVACLALPALAAGSSAIYPEARPHTLDGYVDVEAELDTRARMHDWLTRERVAEGLETPIAVSADPGALRSLDEPATVFPSPKRVGIVTTSGAAIDFFGVSVDDLKGDAIRLSQGAIRGAKDGGFVFTAVVSSPGATAIRLGFGDFWLAKPAELYLYTEAGEVFGPYTGAGPHGDNEFWSHTLLGDRVIVQVRYSGPAIAEDLEDSSFRITEIGHFGPQYVQTGSARSFCSYNASCIENNSCTSNNAVNTAENAIAHMQWISGPYINICTGGLIADTANSGTPYFLTANHCISRGKDARNVETFFQYSIGCNATCPDIYDTRNNHPQSLRTLGASIKATGNTGDFTLLELNQDAPSGSSFMGWNSTPVANSNGTMLYRISHPDAAPQAFSSHQVNTSAGTCQGLPRGSWIYSRDQVGATDGGSSGSPVVNSSGQVVGQLTGACGTNLNNVCDSNNNATIDGAFASYFSQVSQYLDNGGGCTSSPEVCDNGSDDDCDGDVDCNDADCSGDPACDSGGGCTAGGNGDSCSINADCCSNKCRRGSCKGN